MLGRTLLAVVALGAALGLEGCIVGTEKEGSGVEASESREVDSFSRISLSGAADVVVTVGEAQAVTVRGDDNLLGDVKTEVDDGRLKISEDGQLDPKVGITVEITVPDLEEVDVSGAGDVTVEGLRGEVFRVDVSGAGNVEASGRVDRVEAEISGAGDVRLTELVARDATADISGAGSIRLHATESLTASVSGAGSVVYTGDPAKVETDVSGAGQVEPG
jgi:hypothetical protein